MISPPREAVAEVIAGASLVDVPVLVTAGHAEGTGGAGGSLLGPRHDGPFVKVNCAAVLNQA